jgi:hypothetical protein
VSYIKSLLSIYTSTLSLHSFSLNIHPKMFILIFFSGPHIAISLNIVNLSSVCLSLSLSLINVPVLN